jgi:hypothetical protein
LATVFFSQASTASCSLTMSPSALSESTVSPSSFSGIL